MSEAALRWIWIPLVSIYFKTCVFPAAMMQQGNERVFLQCCAALCLQQLSCVTSKRGSTPPDRHDAAVAAALVTKAATDFCFNVGEIESGLPHGIRNLRV